jgi:hypothetical protein
LNNSVSCIAVPYNIEVRLCDPPTTVPVNISLQNATRTIKRQYEYDPPYFLWGDTPSTGKVLKNTVPLPPGLYRLKVTIDGVLEIITFNQTNQTC